MVPEPDLNLKNVLSYISESYARLLLKERTKPV
jgi:hypothetical protein